MENHPNRPDGKAKPMLQAMAPTSLRLQIVRGLASLTESTPSEIESLFELSKPVSVARRAPPRQGRPKPVGLELQMLRILVSHPHLALQLDDAAQQSFDELGDCSGLIAGGREGLEEFKRAIRE